MGSVDGFEGNECLKWLDKQPNESVLFVSFGSGGTFSQEQMTELALGLELSGQRFIWVVKSPNETAKNANYFSVQSCEDPSGFLPHGFLERTKEVGLVVPSWAPQVQVLSHQSTGGFLTHLESQDIAKYVRGLIEGDEGKLLRNKIKGIKRQPIGFKSRRVFYKSLAEVAQVWKSLNT
ncbi:hypothetical protein L7F22_029090 [Adiantum nelumboides]|nr:hypothetical protein [Adiantum nelumboides]